MKSRRNNFIRASEVGEYVFCSHAWKLRLDGHRPARGKVARVAGEQWHKRHGMLVRRARMLRRLAAACVALALALIVIIVYWFAV